eukprot:gene4066-4620_t
MEHVATTRKDESILVNTTQDENTRKDSMEEVDNEYIDIDININEEAKSKSQGSPASVSQCKGKHSLKKHSTRIVSKRYCERSSHFNGRDEIKCRTGGATEGTFGKN